MIKKYHLCDLFTLLEVLLACTLLLMAIMHIPPDYALWVFVAGELCDAVDGPCARRWHYPDDGKRRWWRQHNTELDQISDICLAIACAYYLVFELKSSIAAILIAVIGIVALLVQDSVYSGTSPLTITNPPLAKKIALFRRYLYVFGGIGGAIAILVWNTSWTIVTKITLSAIGIVIGILLVLLKRNRLKDVNTPL